MKQEKYKYFANRFKYVAAFRAWGLRIKNEVWIDPRVNSEDIQKLLQLFGQGKNGYFVNALKPMQIRFRNVSGKFSHTHNDMEFPDLEHCVLQYFGSIVRFRWHTWNRLSGSENSKVDIRFDIIETVGGGWVTTREIHVPHHKDNFSDKELVKLFLQHAV